MKILKFFLVFLFLTSRLNAIELPKIDTKFYLGIYKSFDKLTAGAMQPQSNFNTPYYTSTDAEKKNLGFFLGYNFYLDNFLLGLETSFQENIGKDTAISGFDGSVTYEKLREVKFNFGYNYNDFVFFTYLGTGDAHPVWTAYQNDPTFIREYWTRGFGIDYKLTENYFIGLNFDETTFDINYLYSHYVEEVHKQSARLRFGYIF